MISISQMPAEIDGFKTFIQVFFIILIFQLLIRAFLSFTLLSIKGASLVSKIIVFVLIIVKRDYGFWNVLFLFSLLFIIRILFSMILKIISIFQNSLK